MNIEEHVEIGTYSALEVKRMPSLNSASPTECEYPADCRYIQAPVSGRLVLYYDHIGLFEQPLGSDAVLTAEVGMGDSTRVVERDPHAQLEDETTNECGFGPETYTEYDYVPSADSGKLDLGRVGAGDRIWLTLNTGHNVLDEPHHITYYTYDSWEDIWKEEVPPGEYFGRFDYRLKGFYHLHNTVPICPDYGGLGTISFYEIRLEAEMRQLYLSGPPALLFPRDTTYIEVTAYEEDIINPYQPEKLFGKSDSKSFPTPIGNPERATALLFHPGFPLSRE